MKSLFHICLFFAWAYGSNAQIITTIVGNGTAGYSGDGGLAINAEISGTGGVACDALGNKYLCDAWAHVIRKITPAGIITTIAGTGTIGFSGDGGLAINAQLNNPVDPTFDAAGNLYFCDMFNHRIRKINTAGVISTFAGTYWGFGGDGGPAAVAQLNEPCALMFDPAGNMYVADKKNRRVRKINTSGIISTFAGIGTNGWSGDGGLATAAEFTTPGYLAIDPFGNIYVSDPGATNVRVINPAGIINNFAGIPGFAGFSGDGGPATSALFNANLGVTVDAFGNVFIAADGNMRVRMVNTSGVISTVVGNGNMGYAGDGGPALSAELNFPDALDFDPGGVNLLIADLLNSVVRSVCFSNCLSTSINEKSIGANISLSPNPTANNLHIESQQNEFQNSEIEITNTLGQTVLKLPYSNTIDVSVLPQGFYSLKITDQNKQAYFSKFVKE